MKREMNGFRPLLLCSLMLTCAATFAASHTLNNGYKGEVAYGPAPAGYFEVIGAGSLSKVQAGNSALGIGNETDTLIQNNSSNWDAWGGQIGVGYVHFLRHAQIYADPVQWFPTIEPELNVYYNDYQNNGNVYRFGNPALNQLSYNVPIHSTRLMLDAALTVVARGHFSTYLIAGLGNAWNRISYSDANNSGASCANNLSLNDTTYSHFVWEAGAGVGFDFNNGFKATFEYLYTDYGRLQASGNGTSAGFAAPISSPASFNLHTQALLLGIHVAAP
jgi:opacity protein-like surface antigen